MRSFYWTSFPTPLNKPGYVIFISESRSALQDEERQKLENNLKSQKEQYLNRVKVATKANI